MLQTLKIIVLWLGVPGGCFRLSPATHEQPAPAIEGDGDVKTAPSSLMQPAPAGEEPKPPRKNPVAQWVQKQVDPEKRMAAQVARERVRREQGDARHKKRERAARFEEKRERAAREREARHEQAVANRAAEDQRVAREGGPNWWTEEAREARHARNLAWAKDHDGEEGGNANERSLTAQQGAAAWASGGREQHERALANRAAEDQRVAREGGPDWWTEEARAARQARTAAWAKDHNSEESRAELLANENWRRHRREEEPKGERFRFPWQKKTSPPAQAERAAQAVTAEAERVARRENAAAAAEAAAEEAPPIYSDHAEDALAVMVGAGMF